MTTKTYLSSKTAGDYKDQIEEMGFTPQNVSLRPFGCETSITVRYMHVVYGNWVVEVIGLFTVDDCEFFLEKCSDGLYLDPPAA